MSLVREGGTAGGHCARRQRPGGQAETSPPYRTASPRGRGSHREGEVAAPPAQVGNLCSRERSGGFGSPSSVLRASSLPKQQKRPAGTGVPALQNGNGLGAQLCAPTHGDGRRGSVSPPYRTASPRGRGSHREGEAAAPPAQVGNLCYRERSGGFGSPSSVLRASSLPKQQKQGGGQEASSCRTERTNGRRGSVSPPYRTDQRPAGIGVPALQNGPTAGGHTRRSRLLANPSLPRL